MIRAHLVILSLSIPVGMGLVIGGVAACGLLDAIETTWKWLFSSRDGKDEQ